MSSARPVDTTGLGLTAGYQQPQGLSSKKSPPVSGRKFEHDKKEVAFELQNEEIKLKKSPITSV
jgi:hypothetical protein